MALGVLLLYLRYLSGLKKTCFGARDSSVMVRYLPRDEPLNLTSRKAQSDLPFYESAPTSTEAIKDLGDDPANRGLC